VQNVQEAKAAIGFFRDAKASVWSPSNPSGETIAMLMLEVSRGGRTGERDCG